MTDPTLYQRHTSPSGRVTYRPLEARVELDRETVKAFITVLGGAVAIQAEAQAPEHDRTRRGITKIEEGMRIINNGRPIPEPLYALAYGGFNASLEFMAGNAAGKA